MSTSSLEEVYYQKSDGGIQSPKNSDVTDFDEPQKEDIPNNKLEYQAGCYDYTVPVMRISSNRDNTLCLSLFSRMILLNLFLPGFGTMFASCHTNDGRTNIPAVAVGFL